jgi:predicted lipoprotein with Yx(FWY)xxD motif
MRRIAQYLSAALFIALLAACVSNQPAKTIDGVYVNQAGMTLYTFDKDTAHSGKSTCNGPCAALWPPVAPTGDVRGDYSIITRDDGSKQLAFKGKPVYLYAKDQNPGDKLGDGFKDVWHVIYHYYSDPSM